MIDFLYHHLIYPLEALMQWCLESLYFTTESYGLAIVLLSVCVSLVTLPLYTAAERWQDEERRVKASLAPALQHIKQAFRGQEQFFMVKTLYRQHDYHPVMVLRASFGLLIQIPFFFAAYHFISHYQALTGVSFLWFENLAEPDGMLTVGGVSFNVMPLVMTALNVWSANAYGHKLGRREKLQLYGLAGLFLVLLYNSPVALVIYWTINNVFSLGKNQAEQRAAFDPSRSRLVTAISALTLPPRGMVTVFVALAASIVLVKANALPPVLDTPCTLASFALLLYLSIVACGVFVRSFSPTPLGFLRAILIVALSTLTLFNLFETLSSQQYQYALQQERHPIWIGFALIIVTSLARFPVAAEKTRLDVDKPYRLFLLSSSLIVAVVCVFSPISLFVSDPTQFSLSALDVVVGTGSVGLSSLAFLSLTYVAVARRMRGPYAYVMTCLAALVCLYTFALVGDYGSIDFFTLDEQSFLTPTRLLVDLVAITLVGGLAFHVFRKNDWQRMARLLAILLVTTLLVSAYQLHALDTPLDEGHLGVRERGHGLSPLPDYSKDLLNFSKRDKNVVVIMLDAFNAHTLPVAFEREPGLLEDLDGFTWYRNTLTAGYVTALGESGIHGGHHYTPTEIRKRQYISVSDEAARGYQAFSDAFGEHGFDVNYAGVQNTRCEDVRRYSRVQPMVCVEDAYVSDYGSSIGWPGNEHTSLIDGIAAGAEGIDHPRVMVAISLFRAAPFSLKKLVYRDGTWLGTYPLAQKHVDGARRSARNIAALQALSQLSEATSRRATFKYIQNDLTHRPFYIDAETCLPSLSTTHDEVARDCSLREVVRWLGWLKDEGIYDNTMVVLVSDHGSRRFGSNLGVPLTRTNALLMVKDFGQRGVLEQSDTFMSNADVPAIVCTAIGRCPAIGEDPRRQTSSRTLYFVKGSNKQNSERLSDENVIYEVKDSIFDTDNWRIVR